MKRILIIAVLSLLLGLTTCTKDIYAPGTCFAERILPIFISNCTMSGCHNGKDRAGGYDLSNYEGIMQGVKPHHPLLSEVYKTIRGKNPSMPQKPYPKLSNSDVSLIKLWINAGAHKTAYCTGCDSSAYAYSSRISPILKSWCTGCHNAGNKSGNIDLSEYSGVADAVNKARLLGSIKHLPGYIAMPQTGTQMSACEITAIEKWISAGHPNN